MYESKPHKMKMVRAVETRVVDPSIHGLNLSESMPRARRPTRLAPFRDARASEEELGLMCKDDAYAV